MRKVTVRKRAWGGIALVAMVLLMIVAAVLLAASGVLAASESGHAPGSNYMAQGGADWEVGGQLDVQSTGMLILNRADVAVTTAAPTFSALNKTYVYLSSNGNTTGVRPIYGTPGQVLIIRAAYNGTATLRFDDNASSMSLGANVTLTEGNNSCMTLVCTTATLPVTGTGPNTSKWAMLSSAVN